MPKRKQKQSKLPVASSSSEDSDDEDAITAKALIDCQKEQKKKRRTASASSSVRAKTSLWTTIATERLDENERPFQCLVCGVKVLLNAGFSSSNTTQHFKAKHESTYANLVELNSQNATEQILKGVVRDAARDLARNKSRGSINTLLQRQTNNNTRLLNSSSATSIATQVIPTKTLQSVGLVLWCCASGVSLSCAGTPVMQGLFDIFDGRMQLSSKTALEAQLMPT